MEICEEGHDPILWQRKTWSQKCPLCVALDKLAKINNIAKDLRKKLGAKKSCVPNL